MCRARLPGGRMPAPDLVDESDSIQPGATEFTITPRPPTSTGVGESDRPSRPSHVVRRLKVRNEGVWHGGDV